MIFYGVIGKVMNLFDPQKLGITFVALSEEIDLLGFGCPLSLTTALVLLCQSLYWHSIVGLYLISD